ncbi:squalene synthase HpnC [Phenylobacterium sp.]|uniref:squalene synthase HpnC n=1 Tax=Phenylobacterium sp. TaxID=1871053 RepID=UPI002F422D4F
MTLAEGDVRTGKDAGDENFPVASRLIAARHRPAIMAFYAFARTADDVADHETLTPEEKLAHLEILRGSLRGEHDRAPVAVALRETLSARGLPTLPAEELLVAFRQDATQARYPTWEALMTYCRYSAAPVGRMVLAIHGEPETTWPASDALCAALQVINHLQDCGEDYRRLNRVYLPQDLMAREGGIEAELQAPAASPALRRVLTELAHRSLGLLADGRPLAGQVRDPRLRLEVAVIQRLAEDLAAKLIARDPISRRVHHSKLEVAALTGSALVRAILPGSRTASARASVTG